MQKQKLHWKDIVQQVEKAGLNDQIYLKMKQRELNRQLLHDLQQDIIRHQIEIKTKSAQKLKEREIIQQEVKREKEKKFLQKNQNLLKELQFKGSNYQLIQLSNGSRIKQPPAQQHPFIRMCDQQAKRKEINRQKQIQHNRVNQMQQKIKHHQKQEISKMDSLQKQRYVNHIQQYYEKKLQDRNIFKQKYLKLNNLERSHFLGSAALLEQQSGYSIQEEYSKTNLKQINLKHKKGQDQDELDQVILKFNKNINTPTSSPAFLGRNPINHDRAKQLQYIDQSFKRKPIPIFERIKTEGNQAQTHKKYNSVIDSPLIDKYFSKNLKNEQIKDKLPYLTSQKPISQTNHLPSQLNNRIQKQVGNRGAQSQSSSIKRKKFLTFDIILGRKKQIHI